MSQRTIGQSTGKAQSEVLTSPGCLPKTLWSSLSFPEAAVLPLSPERPRRWSGGSGLACESFPFSRGGLGFREGPAGGGRGTGPQAGAGALLPASLSCLGSPWSRKREETLRGPLLPKGRVLHAGKPS